MFADDRHHAFFHENMMLAHPMNMPNLPKNVNSEKHLTKTLKTVKYNFRNN